MTRTPSKHSRKTLRLRNYDYSRPGAYFVTLCTQHRDKLFGAICENRMVLNDAGRMVESLWKDLPNRFYHVRLDTWVIMPNHLHGILFLTSNPLNVPGIHEPNLKPGEAAFWECLHLRHETTHRDSPRRNFDAWTGIPLPRIMQWFKTMTTNAYIQGIKKHGWPTFSGRLWQRGYFEHVIRNEKALDLIRLYIQQNPSRWAFDRENPEAREFEPEHPWMSPLNHDTEE